MNQVKKQHDSVIKGLAAFITNNKCLSMFLMTAFLSVIFSQAAYAREVKVFFNGKEIKYSVPAQLIDGYTMVPLSQTFEALVGAGTSYDPATRTSTFHANGHVNVHTIGTNYVYIDGVPREFPASSVIRGDRALVHIRMITETSGLNIEWDDINYHVLISSPVPVVTQAPSVPTAPVVPVSINSIESSKTTPSVGETTILTIKTNGVASYVSVYDGSTTHQALYASMDASGTKTWILNYTPKATVNLQVKAGTTQDMTGAATQNFALNVNLQTVEIIEIALNKSTVAVNEEITLTIRTNSFATYVQVGFDNTHVVATYTSTDQAGNKTWTAKCVPSKTQELVISANKEYSTTNAVTKKQNVTVDAYAISIQSVTPNKTALGGGEQLTLTIKTNGIANFVWVECNGTQLPASYESIDPTGVKTWKATCTPTFNQTIRVLANSIQTTGNAVTKSIDVTVSNINTLILATSINPTSITAGQAVTLTVQTNSVANNVWLEFQNMTVPLQYNSADLIGNKTWKASFTPTVAGTYNIFAGKSNGSKEATSSIQVGVQGNQNPEFVDVSRSASSVPLDGSTVSCNFTIITNTRVEKVSAIYGSETYWSSTTPTQSGGNYIWYITIPLKRNGSNLYEYVTLTAHPFSGTAINRTETISVK